MVFVWVDAGVELSKPLTVFPYFRLPKWIVQLCATVSCSRHNKWLGVVTSRSIAIEWVDYAGCLFNSAVVLLLHGRPRALQVLIYPTLKNGLLALAKQESYHCHSVKRQLLLLVALAVLRVSLSVTEALQQRRNDAPLPGMCSQAILATTSTTLALVEIYCVL